MLATLADIVCARAASPAGERIAYTFLADGAGDAHSLTWSQLHDRATALAVALHARGAAGRAVLLALPSGLAFVEALLACWYAGAVAVPVSLPRHARVKHRLHSVVPDPGAQFAIGTADVQQRLASDAEHGHVFQRLNWLDPAVSLAACPPVSSAATKSTDIAVLQYTSGSTGTPRGVALTHANLVHNSSLIATACGHTADSTIGGWLPLFHDMGLIGLVLQAMYSGARCVFMPPERFLMRPWQWLQMIDDYNVCSSPAPNFAYDYCVDKIDDAAKSSLNLAGWRNALNGSEPVRAATLDRFAAAFAASGFSLDAFFPCYGMAEATLFVTGPGTPRTLALRSVDGRAEVNGHVGCGRAWGDTRLTIVDPQTLQPTAPGAVGEIWVSSASCAVGYWKNADATAATFGARLAGDDASWLRTGDLGFIVDGELFITGRLRELIIIAGRNHFPVDIERTAEAADAALAPSGAAAFALNEHGAAERLVVVAEVRRDLGDGAADPATIAQRVRAAIVAAHDVAPHAVVLLRFGKLPRTTSGKVSRRATRDAYVNETLERWQGAAHVHAG